MNIDKWLADNGEELRYEYPLNENSIVFDLGAYEGEFSERIVDKYNCYIYLFEPVTKFFTLIKNKLDHNNKINFNNFGLGNETHDVIIKIDGNRSRANDEGEICNIVDFNQYYNGYDIDLFKVNIEGGEYDLLDSVISSNSHLNIKNIQIQFHDFFRNAVERRDSIRAELSKTHVLTYDYPFIWENWSLNDC